MSRTRSFGAVPCRLWRGQAFKRLSQPAKLLYLYLITSEHSNASGLFRLPVAYAAADTGMIADEIEQAHDERGEPLVPQLAAGEVDRDAQPGEPQAGRQRIGLPVIGDSQRALEREAEVPADVRLFLGVPDRWRFGYGRDALRDHAPVVGGGMRCWCRKTSERS